MNTKLIILAIAATCGLAAQTKLTAKVPFAFEFQGQKLTAGSYEIVRTSLPNAITVRHLGTGNTVRGLTMGTDRKQGAGNGVIFQKAGEKYFFLTVVDRAMETGFHVAPTRNQVESTVVIAAR